jgi:hypothetical protein
MTTKPTQTAFDTRGRPLNAPTAQAPMIDLSKSQPAQTNTNTASNTSAPPKKSKLFGNMIPESTTHSTLPNSIYRRVSFKTKATGVFLFSVVGAVYAYTIYNLRQEDFSDVLVPDSIKNEAKSSN